MGLATIATYLIGNRQAILQVANSPQAVWLGLAFVLSAGFAREYDGEDLLREPWHLLLPLVASLATATLLFSLLWLVLAGWKTFDSAPRAARAFLTLYWMTAPLAWLYAIPVERWLSAGDATLANLCLLGIVSVWRVVLMIRVVCVIYGVHVLRAIGPVMLFADTVALVLLTLTPLPVVSIMGGIRLTESEQIVQATSLLITVAGVLSWPIWFLLTCGSARLAWVHPSRSPLATDPAIRVAVSAWTAAIGAIVFGLALLPFTQPAQQLRASVEHDLRNGQVRRGLMTMSEHDREDFPPHWDPPPRVGYRENTPKLTEVLINLTHVQTRPWVVEIYREKLENQLVGRFASWNFWPRVDNESFDDVLTIVETHFVDTPHWENICLSLRQEVSPDSRRTPEQQTRVRRMLELAFPEEKWIADPGSPGEE